MTLPTIITHAVYNFIGHPDGKGVSDNNSKSSHQTFSAGVWTAGNDTMAIQPSGTEMVSVIIQPRGPEMVSVIIQPRGPEMVSVIIQPSGPEMVSVIIQPCGPEMVSVIIQPGGPEMVSVIIQPSGPSTSTSCKDLCFLDTLSMLFHGFRSQEHLDSCQGPCCIGGQNRSGLLHSLPWLPCHLCGIYVG